MYKISKDLMTVLESERKEYRKEWLRKNPFWLIWYKNHESDENFPSFCGRAKVYLLAGNDNNITSVIPIETDGGCRMMASIHGSNMGSAMSKMPLGTSFMGFARLGAFHTNSTRYFGYGKGDINSIPNALLLSVGRNGVLLERPISQHSNIKRLKLKVV